MKRLLTSLLVLVSIVANAQFSLLCFDDSGNSIRLDTADFDAVQTSHFIFSTDTANAANLWSNGAVLKLGFPAAYNGTNAIQTDTSLPYATGSNSVFYVWRDTSISWFANDIPFSISFWQFHDVDTLMDSCIVQYTIDSGATWKDIDITWTQGNMAAVKTYYQGSLSNTFADPEIAKKLFFTGNSGGWVREQICFNYAMPKSTSAGEVGANFGYRFLFKSDMIDNGKPGWMIDNIQLVAPLFTAGISGEPVTKQLSLFPNPSATGMYTVSYPFNHVTGRISIYSMLGVNIYEAVLNRTVDISSFPSGTYFYRAVFDKSEQVYTGHLIRN